MEWQASKDGNRQLAVRSAASYERGLCIDKGKKPTTSGWIFFPRVQWYIFFLSKKGQRIRWIRATCLIVILESKFCHFSPIFDGFRIEQSALDYNQIFYLESAQKLSQSICVLNCLCDGFSLKFLPLVPPNRPQKVIFGIHE